MVDLFSIVFECNEKSQLVSFLIPLILSFEMCVIVANKISIALFSIYFSINYKQTQYIDNLEG